MFQIFNATELGVRCRNDARRCTSSPLSSHSRGSSTIYKANAIIVSSRDQLRRGADELTFIAMKSRIVRNG